MSAPQSLADAFPDAIRSDFSKRNIKPGSVFKTWSCETNPPKCKIFIIIGVRDDHALVASLYVNTSINPNVNFNEYMKSLHILLKQIEYPFLQYDSYLDCAHLIEKDKNTLQDELTKDIKTLVGEIQEPQLSHIINLVRSARTIETKKKRLYGFI